MKKVQKWVIEKETGDECSYKKGSNNFNKHGSAFSLKCEHLSKTIGRRTSEIQPGQESSEIFKKKYFCVVVFLSLAVFKISLDLACSAVNFLTGEEAEMQYGYLAGLFNLTLLVFWETLTRSTTEPAFLTNQAPKLGFLGESKAARSSQTTRMCPGLSISLGILKTRWLVLPVHVGEEGDVRMCVSVSRTCGFGEVATDPFGAVGREGQAWGGLALHPLSLCSYGHCYKMETERDCFVLAEKQLRGN